MTPNTPWAAHRTTDPERITCWSREGWIFIKAGREAQAPICRLRTDDLQIQFIPNPSANPVAVEPFTLPLSNWGRRSIPVIHMHPFGLLHMIATGQYNRLLLIAAAANIGGGDRTRVFVPLDRSSNILASLGVQGAMLSLSTHNDLEVRDRG